MPKQNIFAISLLLMGVGTLANPLTTLTPCPAAPSSSRWGPIAITSQYQAVSTCVPTSACIRGSCTTRYPFSTWSYVNTVIPCAWNGTAASSTLVTSVDQPVTISQWQTILTSYLPIATGAVLWGNGTSPTPTRAYQTIAKDFVLPYNQIGPLAVPGYEGSGLCANCEVQRDGSRSQPVDVIECRSGPKGPRCVHYEETWVSKSAPSTTIATAATISHHTVAITAGIYTFTFPQTAPAKTFTAAQSTWTADPSPYYVYITKTCSKALETIDFTTTITKTITWTVPCTTNRASTTEHVTFPTGLHGWPAWPTPVGSTPTSSTYSGGSATDSFYIRLVDVNVKYHKQTSSFLGFAGTDGFVTGAKEDAAQFTISDGVLRSAGEIVGADSSSGYAPVELFDQPPIVSNGWSRNTDGSISLASAGRGFCATPDGNIFCLLSSVPVFPCKPVVLAIEGSTPTSTAQSSTTTTTANSTPDASGDVDIEPSQAQSMHWEDWKRNINRRSH